MIPKRIKDSSLHRETNKGYATQEYWQGWQLLTYHQLGSNNSDQSSPGSLDCWGSFALFVSETAIPTCKPRNRNIHVLHGGAMNSRPPCLMFRTWATQKISQTWPEYIFMMVGNTVNLRVGLQQAVSKSRWYGECCGSPNIAPQREHDGSPCAARTL